MVLQSLFDFLKGLGASRLVAMVAVTAALIGFFAFVIMRVTTPQMTTLFTDLSIEDSSAIIKDLDRQAIPYELRNDGTIIMVPKDKVTRLRMKLAEGGLPKGGGVGYEIFDKSDALGTTSFVQNINHLRALEGELARTIRAIDRIQAARVHLVLPERPLFSRETPEPSASIVRPRPRHARTAADPRHPPSGRLGRQRAEAAAGVDRRRGRPVARRRRRQRQRRTSSATSAAPLTKSGCATKSRRSSPRWSAPAAPGSSSPRISTTTRSPRPRTVSTPKAGCCARARPGKNPAATIDNSGQVTVNNELPGNQRPDTAAAARDQSKKTEETNNYEISHTTKTEVTEAGRVNRISVAVLVDGNYAKNEKGEMVYQERSKEQLDRIAALVRSAIGFDQKRGDHVEVVNLKFAEAPAVAPIAEPTGLFGMLQFTKDDVMYVIELGVMMLLSLVVLFMVVRPLVRRILASEAIPALTGADQVPALTDGSAAAAAATGQSLVPGPNAASQMIDVAQVQGQVHAQTVHRVGELAERNPNETASIVRQWLTEPA